MGQEGWLAPASCGLATSCNTLAVAYNCCVFRRSCCGIYLLAVLRPLPTAPGWLCSSVRNWCEAVVRPFHQDLRAAGNARRVRRRCCGRTPLTASAGEVSVCASRESGAASMQWPLGPDASNRSPRARDWLSTHGACCAAYRRLSSHGYPQPAGLPVAAAHGHSHGRAVHDSGRHETSFQTRWRV